MAERAESVNVSRHDRNEGSRFPERPQTQLSSNPPDTQAASHDRVARGYEPVKNRAARSYAAFAEKSKALFSDVRRWTQRACHENPVQVVALVAVTGFLMGVVLRVRKGKRQA